MLTGCEEVDVPYVMKAGNLGLIIHLTAAESIYQTSPTTKERDKLYDTFVLVGNRAPER